MKEIFFHEDDYRQIELLPLENLGFCLEQAGVIDAFSKEHWTGAGWDAMHLREENPQPLSALCIGLDDIRLALATITFEYDAVSTGYSSWRQPCPDIHAFGAADGRTLFVQIADGIAVAIWCSDLSLAWQMLPQAERLLVVDWGWSFVSPLQDTPKLLAYLRQRLASGLLQTTT